MSDPTKKLALITGGSGDIGRAIAHRLGTMGYALLLAGRSTEHLETAVAELEAAGHCATGRVCDVTDESQVKALAAAAKEAGEGRVDVLVHAAGISPAGFFARARRPHWEETLGVNLLGAVQVSQAILPIMRRQRAGHIVHIGSSAGRDGRAGFAAYSASKAGLAAMSDALRKEVERLGIRVSVIAPDKVDTRLHGDADPDAEKMIRTSDIAETVAYLLRLSPNAVVPEISLHNIDFSR